MIVVDDLNSRSATRRVAVVDRTAGFEVIAEAASGEAAIELVAELHPDLVLMDIKMGGIDGITATAAITASETHPMVVLLSTYELNDLPPAAAYVRRRGVHQQRRLRRTDPEASVGTGRRPDLRAELTLYSARSRSTRRRRPAEIPGPIEMSIASASAPAAGTSVQPTGTTGADANPTS